MESEHIESAEHATTSDIQSAEEQDPKLLSSSDSSYAIITKYDSCYLKSTAGFLRFLHVVFVFVYLLLAVSGGTYEGDYLSLPFAWHIRLIVFTCIVSLLIGIFIIGLHVTSTVSLLPVDWQLFDIIVYGTLALMFLLTIILLGNDIGATDYYYSQFVPPSTTRIHIAALVFGICCVLLHSTVASLGLYHRIFVSSSSHAILMSQQSTSSVTTAEGSVPCTEQTRY